MGIIEWAIVACGLLLMQERVFGFIFRALMSAVLLSQTLVSTFSRAFVQPHTVP